MTEPFPNTLADQLPKLKVIARHGVGYDNIDPEFWAKRGVWVTIAKNANASTVAESTLAAMMAISKNLVPTTEHLTGDGHLIILALIWPAKRWELSAMVASAA